MVFGFWHEDFSRKFSAGFLRLQSVSLRERFEILLQISFFHFWFLEWFFSGLLAEISQVVCWNCLFYVLREILRRLTSKTINMFQKLWILIEVFSYFDRVFPQHCVNCILNVQKNIWKDFFLWKHQEFLDNSEFWVIDFERFVRKKIWPHFQNSIRCDQSNILRKNMFFIEKFVFFWIFRTFSENFLYFWRKNWSEG